MFALPLLARRKEIVFVRNPTTRTLDSMKTMRVSPTGVFKQNENFGFR